MSAINLTPNMGVIGDVKYSILPPIPFKELNGKGWQLMDGSNIEGTRLQEKTGIKNLPDASNNFIRGLDPRNKDREAGSFESDATKRPNNKFTGITSHNGVHSHTFSTSGIWKRSFKGEDGSPRTAHEHQGYTSQAGNHKHSVTINGGGDVETRPKNIALYTYIKVD